MRNIGASPNTEYRYQELQPARLPDGFGDILDEVQTRQLETIHPGVEPEECLAYVNDAIRLRQNPNAANPEKHFWQRKESFARPLGYVATEYLRMRGYIHAVDLAHSDEQGLLAWAGRQVTLHTPKNLPEKHLIFRDVVLDRDTRVAIAEDPTRLNLLDILMVLAADSRNGQQQLIVHTLAQDKAVHDALTYLGLQKLPDVLRNDEYPFSVIRPAVMEYYWEGWTGQVVENIRMKPDERGLIPAALYQIHIGSLHKIDLD